MKARKKEMNGKTTENNGNNNLCCVKIDWMNCLGVVQMPTASGHLRAGQASAIGGTTVDATVGTMPAAGTRNVPGIQRYN